MALSKRLKKALKVEVRDHRITPRLRKHLSDQGDNSSLVSLKDQKLLYSLAKKRQQRVAGQSDRSGAWHPSQLHDCQRAQVFGYIGVPGRDNRHSPELINLFNDGTWRHIRWQITLLNAKLVTSVEVPVWVPEWNLTGHIDAVNDPEGFALELKGSSQFVQIKLYGVPSHHMRQMHGYFVGRPDLEAFVYLVEDKSTNDWEEIVIYPDKSVIKQTERILSELNTAIADEVLPPLLEECEYGEGAWKQCQYAYQCKQVKWSDAQVAAGCSSSEEVIVTIGLKRSNKHKKDEERDRRKAKARANELGVEQLVRSKSGTLKVRRGVAG